MGYMGFTNSCENDYKFKINDCSIVIDGYTMHGFDSQCLFDV